MRKGAEQTGGLADWVHRWMSGGPMTAVVISLGLALSAFAWVGLRQVESSQAKVSYDRLLLSQSTELRKKLPREHDCSTHHRQYQWVHIC